MKNIDDGWETFGLKGYECLPLCACFRLASFFFRASSLCFNTEILEVTDLSWHFFGSSDFWGAWKKENNMMLLWTEFDFKFLLAKKVSRSFKLKKFCWMLPKHSTSFSDDSKEIKNLRLIYALNEVLLENWNNTDYEDKNSKLSSFIKARKTLQSDVLHWNNVKIIILFCVLLAWSRSCLEGT